MQNLENDICELLNKHSRENESDTSDAVLAHYLMGCLRAFEIAVRRRDELCGGERTPFTGFQVVAPANRLPPEDE